MVVMYTILVHTFPCWATSFFVMYTGSQGSFSGEEFSTESEGEWLDNGESGGDDSAGFFGDAGGGDGDGGSLWDGISDLLNNN